MPPVTNNSLQTAAPTISVFYNGTDTLKKGQLVCYQRNYSGSGVTATDVERRNYYVQKPNFTNRAWPAGIVQKLPRETGVAGEIEIIPFGGEATHEIEVWTDENIANGDILGWAGASYALGKWTAGAPLAYAIEAQDRSTTSGTVKCLIGRFAIPDAATLCQKRIQWFDHFLGDKPAVAAVASAVADNQAYLVTGTTATTSFSDSTGPDQAGTAKRAAGVLALLTDTTNPVNLTVNGEPFRLDVNKSLFFRCRIAISSVASTTDAFIGLCITDTAFGASKAATDYIGFGIDEADIEFNYVEDGATGAVSVTGLGTMVADEYQELAFLFRNRGSGGVTLDVWVGGTLKTVTTTATEICDDESLTFMVDVVGGAARTLRLDYVEIDNYVDSAA